MNAQGTTILLFEQNANLARSVCDYAYLNAYLGGRTDRRRAPPDAGRRRNQSNRNHSAAQSASHGRIATARWQSTRWKTDKWFTSPWNFVDEVKATNHFAKRIQFHDVALRDGEQQTRLVFTEDQKVALAEKMAEAGMPACPRRMPRSSRRS